MTWTIRLVNVAPVSMAMARKEARKSIFAPIDGAAGRRGCTGQRCAPRRSATWAPGSLASPETPWPLQGRQAPLLALPRGLGCRHLPLSAPSAERQGHSSLKRLLCD